MSRSLETNEATIGCVRLPHGEGLLLPSYATAGAAGADLRAAIDNDLVLLPGERTIVPTGIVFDVPAGFEIQIRPRSGLAAKHGITVLNTPGTIDSDYRGEVMVILINCGNEAFTIERGDRIAQAVASPVVQAFFEERTRASASDRGRGGLGSTGKR